LRIVLVTAALLVVAGCGTVPRASEAQEDGGAAIVRVADQLIGSPYHFGGADLEGFDCSGLAVYAHERIGLEIPRTAEEQKRAARPVPLDSLSPGDLVFFRIGARRVNHVGIYVGSGRFIHAPRSGGVVSYGDLTDRYYRRHLVSAGRFWGGEAAQTYVSSPQGDTH
jgi:cell wall-associated NlpC family hydrolase